MYGRNAGSSVLLFSPGKIQEIELLFVNILFYICLIYLQLFDVVYREETLLNVIRSVTRNGRSIIFTAVLALILVYLFSIIGYVFFKDDFLVPVDDEIVSHSGDGLPCNELPDVTLSKPSGDAEQVCAKDALQDVDDGGGGGERRERACDSLVMCIITTLNQGLRNGGGIGDILRAPSSSVSLHFNQILWRNLSFFFLCQFAGSTVCGARHLRFAVFLHRNYYCSESDIWCDH